MQELEFQSRSPTTVFVKHKQSTWPLIIGSLVLHLVLGLVVFWQHSNSPILALAPQETSTINATLVFPRLPEPKTQTPDAVDVLPQDPLVDTDTKQPMPTELPFEPVIAQEEVAQETPSEDNPHAQTRIDANQVLPESEPTVIGANVKIPSNVKVSDLTRGHFSQIEERALNDLSKRAASTFRSQKTSPVIAPITADPFITEDEKFMKEHTVRVNCDSRGNKAATMILGFLGGAYECTRPPDLTPFLEKHVKKAPKDTP